HGLQGAAGDRDAPEPTAVRHVHVAVVRSQRFDLTDGVDQLFFATRSVQRDPPHAAEAAVISVRAVDRERHDLLTLDQLLRLVPGATVVAARTTGAAGAVVTARAAGAVVTAHATGTVITPRAASAIFAARTAGAT